MQLLDKQRECEQLEGRSAALNAKLDTAHAALADANGRLEVARSRSAMLEKAWEASAAAAQVCV